MPKLWRSILTGKEVLLSDEEHARKMDALRPVPAKRSGIVDRIEALRVELEALAAEAQRVPAAPVLALVPPATRNDGAKQPEPLTPSDTRLTLRRDGQGRLTGAAGEMRDSEGVVPVSMQVAARDPDGKLRELVLDGPAGKVRAIVHRNPFGEDHLEVIADGPET